MRLAPFNKLNAVRSIRKPNKITVPLSLHMQTRLTCISSIEQCVRQSMPEAEAVLLWSLDITYHPSNKDTPLDQSSPLSSGSRLGNGR